VLAISYPLWSFRRLEATARSLVEEKERAQMSEERFRQLAETVRDVFLVSNMNTGQIDYVSPAYERLYGRSCNSLYENPAQWREAIHPEDRARVLAVYRDQAAIGEYDQQYRIVRADGQIRWVRERTYPMPALQGRRYRLAGIIEDITEHQQIIEERELLNTIIEATPDIIGFTEVNGRTIYLNQAGRRILLRNEHDSVAGMPIADCHPPWAAQLIANVAIPQALEHATWVGESAILDSRGQEIPVSQVIMAHRSATGEAKYLSTIIRDISVFKHVETMIKATLAEKENLLREVHHRVKNNLQVILSLLDLQAEDIPNSLIRDKFIESCHRVRSMALVYERLYQSQDLVRIDFVEYVTSLTSYLLQSYLMPDCMISTRVDMAPVELNVETAIPCGLIINELVTNALKYAFVGRTTGHISIDLQALSDHQYCLRVQDDGIGLPKDFDLNATHSFGLTVVMTLVRQLGATISLNTGQGTEFLITFTVRQRHV
jgi:PAS domain S-box-containing protein